MDEMPPDRFKEQREAVEGLKAAFAKMLEESKTLNLFVDWVAKRLGRGAK